METPSAPVPLAERIRARLLQRQSELRLLLQQEAHAAVHAVEQAPETTDFKELADTGSEHAVRDAVADQAARELAATAAALRRLDEGTYGICVECGEPIAAERLLAAPGTLRCLACQSASERRSRA